MVRHLSQAGLDLGKSTSEVLQVRAGGRGVCSSSGRRWSLALAGAPQAPPTCVTLGLACLQLCPWLASAAQQPRLTHSFAGTSPLRLPCPQFLAEHPHVLGAEGGAALCSRLALFSTWRLPAPLCPLLLARCPLLLREPEAQMQGIVDILMGYGCTWRQLSDVVLGYPSVLRLK